MTEPVREQLLRYMQTVFEGVTAASSTHGTIWGRVLDSPYEGREFKGQNVMSILEGTESYVDVTSPDKRDRQLDVDIQTRCYVPTGTALRTGANRVLADLEEIIEANNLWNGLAYATFFLANDVVREDSGDRVVEISLFLNVRYRTKRSDPNART